MTKDQQTFQKVIIGKRYAKGLTLGEMFSKMKCRMTTTIFYGRKRKPDAMTICELREFARVLSLTDEEIWEMIRG